MSARSMMMVFARGMSIPLSMIAVDASTSKRPSTKSSMARFEGGLVHLAMGHHDASLRQQGLQPCRPLIESIHPVVDVEDLPATRQLTLHRFTQHTIVPAASESSEWHDGPPAVSPMSEMSRRPLTAICNVRGIGGRRKRQHVHGALELLDSFLVDDPEALLLVDDEKTEGLEVYVFG